MNRREFLQAALTAGVASALPRVFADKERLNEQFTALLADLHVSSRSVDEEYCVKALSAFVSEIAARDPLPRQAIVMGDIVSAGGGEADYRLARKCLKPLYDLGVKMSFMLGEGDSRAAFLAAFPEEAEKTLVKGCHVTVATPCGIDVLLLDSSTGDLGEAQGEWLKAELPKWKRPVLVAAHHPLDALHVGGRPLLELIAVSDNAFGFICGHTHYWRKGVCNCVGKEGAEVFRTLSLPSTGKWGDIGYGWMQSTVAGCFIELIERDFYYPRPRRQSEERPSIWDQVIRENQGAVCEFRNPRRV